MQLRTVDGLRRAQGMYARAVERLVGVNVAEAGDESLVEQQRLDAPGAGRETRGELLGRQG
jgi:hypothetical protein